jgi:hypothetical protein
MTRLWGLSSPRISHIRLKGLTWGKYRAFLGPRSGGGQVALGQVSAVIPVATYLTCVAPRLIRKLFLTYCY